MSTTVVAGDGHDALRPFDLDQIGPALSQFLLDVDKSDGR